MWKKHSDNYSKHFESISTKIYSKLLVLSQLSASKSIVEVSCGTGNGLEMIRKDFKINTKIYASDISKHMIEKSKTRNLDNIQFTIAENSNLPYPSDFCDRYISNLSLHIVRKRAQMLQEANRVLQKGGLATFSIFSSPSPTNIVQIIEKSCNDSDFWLKHRSLFDLKDEKTTTNLLQSSGFTDITYSDSVYFFDISSVDLSLEFAYDLFLYQKLKQNSKDKYNKLIDSLHSQFSHVLSSSNEFSLEIRFITAVKSI